MFTYKFVGLTAVDASTPYYYGSLPAKAEPGQILFYDESGNRYTVIRVEGEGLVDDGDGSNNQKELAWAEINRGEAVPTLWLQKLDVWLQNLEVKEIRPTGRSFSYEEMKEYSQRNRETRLSASAK
jgi:hypothetical protein